MGSKIDQLVSHDARNFDLLSATYGDIFKMGEAIKHIVNTSLCTTSISVRSIMQRAIEFHINFMDLSTVRASGKYVCEILASSIVGQRLAAREKTAKKTQSS